MALTKADICDSLVGKFSINKNLCENITNDVFEIIKQTLESGESVKISSFGNFELKDKSSRIGRNPKTKEEFIISARRVVSFKSGQKLREKMDNEVDSFDDLMENNSDSGA